MNIEIIASDKKQFLDLLLLGDEQECMIDRYLEQGDLFALYEDNELKSICVVIEADGETCELKNLATYKKDRCKGHARALVRHVLDHYKDRYKTMIVGTGESPGIMAFYQNCGFEESHRIKNFFTDNYDHPIVEQGVRLVDMVYFKRKL